MDSVLTSVGGFCVMQTTTTSERVSQETLDRWYEEASQRIECRKALEGSVTGTCESLHQIGGV